MLYLNTVDLEKIGANWSESVSVMANTLKIIGEKDYVQPLKPYVRYGNLKNRIIAMPAYVGGDVTAVGIKWIASFPANVKAGLDRAHSVTILNDVDNGVPIAIINSTLISGIRTAAVTGVFLQKYLSTKKPSHKLNVGICGFGLIGLLHLKMIESLFGDIIGRYFIFDLTDKSHTVPVELKEKVTMEGDWRRCYREADLFVTCTVSEHLYIDISPTPGSLHLNISLRDYLPNVMNEMTYHVVDDWDEVCRENTGIEMLYQANSIRKDETANLYDFVYSGPELNANDTVMFSPMGLAAFDIAMALYFVELAKQKRVGTYL